MEMPQQEIACSMNVGQMTQQSKSADIMHGMQQAYSCRGVPVGRQI